MINIEVICFPCFTVVFASATNPH